MFTPDDSPVNEPDSARSVAQTWIVGEYLQAMTAIIREHQGTIDKFMGDSIMAHFGEAASGKDPAKRAVACALELQLGQDTHTLQQGDAILLATQPVTGWRNPAREPARVLWLLLKP